MVVVVLRVLAKDLEEMGLAESDDVVRALTADGADKSLDEWVLPRRPGGADNVVNSHGRDGLTKHFTVDAIPILWR